MSAVVTEIRFTCDRLNCGVSLKVRSPPRSTEPSLDNTVRAHDDVDRNYALEQAIPEGWWHRAGAHFCPEHGAEMKDLVRLQEEPKVSVCEMCGGSPACSGDPMHCPGYGGW